MPQLSILLLGPFAATLDGCPLTAFETRKTQALLIYLACQTDQPHQREALMNLLWSDMPLLSAQANMRQTLYRLRKLIPAVKSKTGDTPIPFLLTNRQTIQINPDADFYLDVATFITSPPAQAISLYRGEFLADFYLPDSETFETWAASHRAGYRRQALEMLEAETTTHLQQASYDKAAELARTQLDIDNLRESSHRQLMEALARNNRRQDALAHYEDLCQLLQDELAIEPEPETHALIETIRKGKLGPKILLSPTQFVPPDKPSNHNIPQQLISFIGREKEIATITDLVHHYRLVTLSGVGGIGKTNLSLQVARKLLNTFPDGVWFIELEAISDPTLVAQTAAHTLGLRSFSDLPILKMLLNHLEKKSCLLILDNCEHLLTSAAQFAQTVLQNCPNVKILASSREALGAAGEQLYLVPSMEVPPTTEPVTVEDWRQYEAMRLFADRAIEVYPDYQVTANNFIPLARICQQLDGIPLALELAAARINILTTQQIADRLDDRFRLLTGGRPTALPRQQTLRALIDWSWELLTKSEQILLQRLSVFVGGMDLDAAEAVCADAGLDDYIPDVLHELVNKSLVIMRREQVHVARFRLLETIRQYAKEKLIIAGEGETLRQRHLQYFQQWGERADLVGPNQAVWIEQLSRELDNMRAALSWGLETKCEAGLELATALWRFWERGYAREGAAWLDQLQSACQPIAPRIKARALRIQGRLLFRLFNVDKARALTEESLRLSQALNDQQGIAYGLYLLGSIDRWTVDYQKSEAILLESLALFRTMGNKLAIADVLALLGFLGGNYNARQALAYLEESEALYRELGHLAGIAGALNSRGMLAIWREDYETARQCLEESLTIEESLGLRGSSDGLIELGNLYLKLGDYPQAQHYLEKSLSISQLTGENVSRNWASVHLAYVFLRMGEFAQARKTFVHSQRQFQEEGTVIGVVYALEGMSSLAVQLGQAEQAACLIAWADATREVIQNTRPPVEQADVDRELEGIREMIDEETFDAAYAEGKAMTMEEAMVYAFDKINP